MRTKIEYLVISLFLMVSLLVGSVSYGQKPTSLILKPVSLSDTCYRSYYYRDRFGWEVMEVLSPPSKRGLYVMDDFSHNVIMSDNPLVVKDSLKTIKALIQTVHELFKQRMYDDSLKRVMRQLLNAQIILE